MPYFLPKVFYRTIKELIEENKDKKLKALEPTILFRDGLIKEGDVVIFSKIFALNIKTNLKN